MRIPIIIDCDPGWDDTIALIMALSNDKLDVKGITCVAGNVSVQKTTENAKKILKFMKKNIPIAKGAEQPLVYKLRTIENIHGEDGMYGLLPTSDYKIDKRKAHELMRDILNESKEKITIIATGALTNIAILIKKYPDILEKIEKICLMGGGIGIGNTTPYAEFNIHTDPHAAKIVFESGIPIIMCGLEAAYKAICRPKDIVKMRAINNKKSELVSKILQEAGKVERHTINSEGIAEFGDAPLYDPVTIAYMIKPEIFITKKYNIQIETEGERRGETKAIDGKDEFNTEVVIDLDREEVINLIIECLKYNN